jgi:cytochrome c2
MRKLASLTVAAAAVALLVVLFSAPVITVAAADSAPRPLDGKEIFLAQKCNMCHSVPPAGIEATTKSEKMKGPNLVDLEREAAWLEGFLTKKVELNGQLHKKELKGSEQELDALVAWLLKQQSK